METKNNRICRTVYQIVVQFPWGGEADEETAKPWDTAEAETKGSDLRNTEGTKTEETLRLQLLHHVLLN